MPTTPRTELLPVVEAGGGFRLPLVPTLCGAVVAGSWLTACLTIIPWAR